MDFDENFRIFQKWTKLKITTFSCQSGSPSGEYSGFSYPEYPNSTTYWWILIKISEQVRNGPNYKLLDFFAYADYRDQYPENIPD